MLGSLDKQERNRGFIQYYTRHMQPSETQQGAASLNIQSFDIFKAGQ